MKTEPLAYQKESTRKALKHRITSLIFKIVSIFLFIIGLSVFASPHLIQYLNKFNSAQLIENYFTAFPESKTSGISNSGAYESGGFDKNLENIFGSIYIPKLNLELPIYTGLTTANLEAGIAHLEGTSLPIGGRNTHSVLCGHSGRVTNEFFTNINKLVEGDLFFIRTRKQRLTYKVISSKVIDPAETSALLIVPDKDYVTLLTCTNGIKKRLVVTGERMLSETWMEGLATQVSPD